MNNRHTKKLLFIFGTRPEAIKLVPLIKKFEEDHNRFEVKVCVTAQHREMLDQVLQFFHIRCDYDLNIMEPNQSLYCITAEGIKGLEKIIKSFSPDLIFVQGDTTSAFIGALAGFYEKIRIAHVEAGLRSLNKYSPFPEEINRILTGHLADYHFAPTQKARQNLMKEGIVDNVYIVGNTVIDALFLTLDIINEYNLEEQFYAKYSYIDSRTVVLITAHRRESFGKQFEHICEALREIAVRNRDIEIIYPVHFNPNVRRPVFEILREISNIHLIEPVPYPEFTWLMQKSHLVLTDSGGIQEEAPSLGKPVLVMREITERTEGIEAGTAKLVGTDRRKLVNEVERLFFDKAEYTKMSRAINPYGDGSASRKILEIIVENSS